VILGAAMMAVAGLVSAGAAVTPAGATVTPAAAVEMVPLAAGHVLAGQLKQPPTTAQCEKQSRTACYQAFQLQRAYNLDPLFANGIDGRGETIVIVDAFGSQPVFAAARMLALSG
jgi:subtilase family serine protease